MIKRWGYFLGLVTVLYVIPVSFVVVEIVPLMFRLSIVGAMFFAAFFIAEERPYTRQDLGIAKLDSSLLPYLLILAVLIGGVLMLVRGRFDANLETLPLYTFFVLVAVPVQEFLYRSFLFAELKHLEIASKQLFVILSSSLYSLLHVIYGDVFLVAGSFWLGIFLAMVYLKLQNFWSVSLLHTIIGLCFIWSN